MRGSAPTTRAVSSALASARARRRGRPLIVVVVPAMMAPVAWVVRLRRWIRVTRVVRRRRRRVVHDWRLCVVHDRRWRGGDDCWRRRGGGDRGGRLPLEGARRG